MRRVVAVLGAVLMVVVAILVRGVIDGDDDSGGSGSRPAGGEDGEVTLLCITELEDVCESLEADGAIDGYEVEWAGDTVDRMGAQGADLGTDGWLTLDSFPQQAGIVRDPTGGARVFGDAVATGRTSGLAVVVHPARAGALTGACRSDITWDCLGNLVGDPWADHGGETGWGEIKVGIDDPDSATGLLVATQAVAAHLGIDRFATNDLDSSNADRWVGRFHRGNGVLDQLVLRGAGAFSAVGATEVEAEALAGTARGADLAIFYPAPMFRAEVVVVTTGQSAEGLIDADDLDDALSSAGWAEDEGIELPSPGAMYALREQL